MSNEYITVRVGKLPGEIREYALNGDRTVAAALSAAQLDAAGFEIRVGGNIVTLTDEVENNATILLVKKIRGNLKTIELGDLARDVITGFQGIVVADTKWLHGCRRLTLQPQKLHEGKPIESQSFDGPQLVLIKKQAVDGTADTGGPRPEPSRGR